MKFYQDTEVLFRGCIVALQLKPGTSVEDSAYLAEQFRKFFQKIIEESNELRHCRTEKRINELTKGD